MGSRPVNRQARRAGKRDELELRDYSNFELHDYLTYRIDATPIYANITRQTGGANEYAPQDAMYGG